MRRIAAAGLVATSLCLAASFLLASCGSPCPSGQEYREERYPSTQVRARGCMAKNPDGNYRLQGRWEFFYPDGKKEAEGTYKDAFMGGPAGETGIVRDGLEGTWVFWYENGQKSSEATYRHNKPNGKALLWYENGQKKAEATFVDGIQEGVEVLWYQNGQQQSLASFVNGKKDGVENLWYESGQRKEWRKYRDGKVVPGSILKWDEKGNQAK